ncbi:HAMP domain-containing sensor histidine kinase [Sulfurimonas sp.]|jgi:two-component system, OmpR family, sensor kinase|uniref:sensor histidine kinase n=1 Tax=Sulfurimonas sp. TaxID=2022749 RepID=UPI0026007C2F|nr:HAMP domain-containing sensor histidine kinase [Sulfurimonas sp.]MBT5935343.1 HAMP domain-containing histidine kinase [Sulfurimonas sp.]
MNKITKRSFYSFLSLYLISSFIFLATAVYWFFSSQLAMEMNNNFYKMNHIADSVSSKIIHAHMSAEHYELQKFPNARVALLSKDKKLLFGGVNKNIDFSREFYNANNTFTLISKRASGHLDVEYIVVRSSECNENIVILKNKIAYVVIITAFVIIVIAVFLSYMFLKPLRDKMQEIEDFVKDTTHELNTPITALMMSLSRLKSKKTYDEKIFNNISISTKQLYDIYSSLSYISFDNSAEPAEDIMFNDVVNNCISYHGELLAKKNISVIKSIDECQINIASSKAKMLINNLLNNSIKYSTPNTTIRIITTANSLCIQDEGIGISKKKQEEIFKRFVRASSYAGGFGVGLSIVDSIVKEYNYKLSLVSNEGEGTTITITF